MTTSLSTPLFSGKGTFSTGSLFNVKPGQAISNLAPDGSPVMTPPKAVQSPLQSFLAPSSNNAQSNANPVSSTTLSNTNKINQVSQNQNTLNSVSQKGITTDQNGNAMNANGTQAKTATGTVTNPDGSTSTTYSDGTTETSGGNNRLPAGWDAQTYANFKAANPGLEPTPEDTAKMQASNSNQQPYTTADTSAEDAATHKIIDQLIATSDANTASTIQSIQSQFAIRTQQQQIINSASEAEVRNALLMGGVTGQGSSTQFAPISSSGVIQAQETYGIQQLASLDAQENSQIAAAKQAGYSNDFQLQEKLLNNINTTRQAKIDLATKLNDSIVATNQNLAAQALQSNIDNGVASIYANGVTDPSEILKQLKTQGMNVSLDQINKSIQEIATRNGIDPTTLDATSKQFFYLKGIGGLPSSIASLSDTASQLAAYVKMVNAALTIGKNTFSDQGGINPVVQTTLNLIGPSVSANMSVSQAIQAAGLPAIVSAVIGQEGGSPKGVDNNPGNIKSATAKSLGIPYTDSGVKATDGGTFASFDTPQAGKDAVGAWIQKRGDTNIADAIASYKGVTNGPSTVPGTTGSPTIDTSTPGYTGTPVVAGLTQAAIDQKALEYVTSGTNPPVGRTGLAGQQNAAISNRMAELAPGANTAANKAQLKSLSSSLTKQTDYQQTMQRSINTVDDNLKLLQAAAEKVNDSSSPLINQWTNQVKGGTLGSGDLASFKAAIQTVRSEYSNILARGGTVTDSVRGEAAQLIPDNISKDQLDQVLETLRAEGQNVLNNANQQVSQVQGQINGIIAPGSSITATSHNGVTLPTADASGGKAFSGISLPH